MHDVVLMSGDGIGPEITESVIEVLEASGVSINWIPAKAGMSAFEETGDPLPQETVRLFDRYRVALKGPLATPVGKGFRSVNVALRQQFNLYANIRPAKTLPGIKSPFSGVNLIIFRENTQGMYIGQERHVGIGEDHAETIGVITRKASELIIRAAFDYAVKNDRKKITLVHKANIMKLTTGLFLDIGKEISKAYPMIEFQDMIVDNTAMQMVLNPHQFDIIVTTNLFGDILSDLASGLVGGLGVTGSANIGTTHAMFEAVHGSAPDIAGKGIANPTALLFSAIMMLRYLDENVIADKITNAVHEVIKDDDVRTGDLGGRGNTTTYTKALCEAL
ncbi:MAG: isocitrate/isopropylmalate dehydrogenase family protein [Balneolales bacterium]